MTEIASQAKQQSSLNQLLQQQSLTELLSQTENSIRQAPTDPELRWLLFQLLCLIGDWQRALAQLQACARMNSGMAQDAQVYRGLIRCELYRQDCFAGQRRPGCLLPPPNWLDSLLSAIERGQAAQADTLRTNALNASVDVDGSSQPGGRFEWIGDTDTRIGPAIELVAGGLYCWLPFEQLKEIRSTIPSHTLNLLWKPAQFTLIDGTELSGFILARYVGSEKETDAVCLGRQTVWLEDGPTAIRALGQKTWQTSHGDIGVLDLVSLVLNVKGEVADE